MAYRAKFIPTGEYYQTKSYSVTSKHGTIFRKLSRKQLTAWLTASSSQDVYKHMDNWTIEPYQTSDYIFEGVAVYNNWNTVLQTDVNIEIVDLGNDRGDAPFILEHGQKYKVTITKI
jgi:hypothetical protein